MLHRCHWGTLSRRALAGGTFLLFRAVTRITFSIGTKGARATQKQYLGIIFTLWFFCYLFLTSVRVPLWKLHINKSLSAILPTSNLPTPLIKKSQHKFCFWPVTCLFSSFFIFVFSQESFLKNSVLLSMYTSLHRDWPYLSLKPSPLIPPYHPHSHHLHRQPHHWQGQLLLLQAHHHPDLLPRRVAPLLPIPQC